MGNAGLAADPINKRLILNTWPMMVGTTYGTTSRFAIIGEGPRCVLE
jgi:hypothetical protein